jgi:VWFA-related protein
MEPTPSTKPHPLAAILCAALALTASAQTPTPYSLHANSQLVILDVVVTDKKGTPIPNLTPQAFKVFENKIPQPIVSLEETHTPGPAAIPIHSTAELDRLEPKSPVTILVLDEVTSKVSDEAFARSALKTYLATQAETLSQPTMLLAITTQHQLLLHDYTTSRKDILDALNQHFNGPAWRTATGNPQGQQIMATLLSLTGVANATSGHPGHKNIVWIGRGFPDLQWSSMPLASANQFQQAIATLINRLRDARATLYSVDPAGLTAAPPVIHAQPDALEEEGPTTIQDPFGGQADFDLIAQATGGMALHGTNAVDRLIGKSITYGAAFYTIAYKPTDPGDTPRQFRSIQVLMSDPRLTATAPAGYHTGISPIPPPIDPQGKPSPQADRDLAVAADGLVLYDGVTLTVQRSPSTPNDFTISFPAATLAWTPGQAQDKSDITLLLATYDKKGKLLHREGHIVGFVRQPLQQGQAERRTLHVLATIDTTSPATRLRVLVRSNGSGGIGSANYLLNTPN